MKSRYNSLYSNHKYKKASELLDGLFTKRFNGSDAGITNRELFHWVEKKLVYYEPEQRKLRRFNFIEVVWLRMMVNMRGFGLDLDTIKKVKHFVIDSSSIKGLAVISNLNKLAGILKPEESHAGEKVLSMEEFTARTEPKQAPPPLVFWVVDSILKKSNASILITEKGKIDLLDESSVNYHYKCHSLHHFFHSPFLAISITDIICRFIKENDVSLVRQLGLLSQDELKLLELISSDFIESCDFFTVDEKTIHTIVGTELSLEEIRSNFIDELFRSRYKKIVFRTKEDHEVEFENQRGKHLFTDSDPGIYWNS